MIRRPHRMYGLAVGAFALLAGCSTTTTVIGPPPELAQARAAYNTAANGPAAQYAPADLREAKNTLDRADAMYRSRPRSSAARAEAYLALRRVEAAEANASAMADRAHHEQASLAAMEAQSRELQRTRQELAQKGCGQEERQGSGQDGRCAGHGQAQAIVVPGAALFATGSAEISPAARANLRAIALTLNREGNREVRVEGFTDATGSNEVNDPLSERRAEAVRAYLVSCGVHSTRIETRGFGSSRPIGDEATADGRAANRRVRIVIEPRRGVAEPMP